MTNKFLTGMELLLQPAEESVPLENWFTWLFNVAEFCRKESRVSFSKGGYKYKDIDYWQVLVYRGVAHCSTGEASNEMDELLFEKSCEGRGRKPLKRKPIGGKYPRRERFAPNESQVNEFIRQIPGWIKKKLRFFIFKAQIAFAIESGGRCGLFISRFLVKCRVATDRRFTRVQAQFFSKGSRVVRS